MVSKTVEQLPAGFADMKFKRLLPVHVPTPSAQHRAAGSIRRVFNNDQIIERYGRWLLARGNARHTCINYVAAARQFARFLDKPLTAATKEDVRAFVGVLYARNLAPTTIQARLDSLRTLGDCLQLAGLVQASVPREILRRKLPKRLPHAKSEEEIQRLIAAAQSLRDRAILELGYATGLRVSELTRLRLEDLHIDPRGGVHTLTVRRGKGGNDRVGYFGRPAAVALQEYIGNRKTGFVFVQQDPGRQRGGVFQDPHGAWWGQWRETDASGKRGMRSVRLGDYELRNKDEARKAFAALVEFRLARVKTTDEPSRPLSTKTIWRIVANAAKRAGLTGVHPHVLRHSCATHCLNHGMNIRHVQEILGHTTLTATQKYLHVSTTNLKSVHSQFLSGEGK